MTKILKHKGYQGTVEVDFENNRLTGKVLHIKSLITYCGDNPDSLRASFEEEVEDYISDCEALGVEPEKPFSGTFQVRTTPEVHKRLTIRAAESGVTFNKFVTGILETDCHKLRVPDMDLIGKELAKLDWNYDALISSVTGVSTTEQMASLMTEQPERSKLPISYDHDKYH